MEPSHIENKLINNQATDSAELDFWLALSQINLNGQSLLNYFAQRSLLEPLFGLSEQELQAYGFRPGLAEKLSQLDWQKVKQDKAWFDVSNKHLVTIKDTSYPELLKQINGAPPLLFVIGDKQLLNQAQIAVVGSRNPTAQGKDNASQFSRVLAEAGAVITSGMALGVDACAHQAALAINLPTIAVAGTGLDRVYPAKHKQLAEQIAEKGALVSDFALGTGVRPSNFPARNRIISGMSLGTLVIEAAIRSGSLITARTATEQGREVFAIPGSIHNPLARGCHSLIKQGAKLVETGEEIVEELASLAIWQQAQLADGRELIEANKEKQPSSTLELDEDYQLLLDSIGHEITHIDKIIQRTGLELAVVSHMLLLLELNDYVSSMAGGYQRKA